MLCHSLVQHITSLFAVPFGARAAQGKGEDYMRKFWQIKGVFSTRRLVLMGMFVALAAALAVFNTYLSSDYRVLSFSYLPMAVGSALFGPYAGFVMGFAGDTVSFLVNPMPPYFPGFALSAMLQNFIYAMFLYRKPLTWPRVILAQAATLPVTLGLNMLWLNIMMGRTAGELYTAARLIGNLILFPVHVALVYYCVRLAVRVESRSGVLQPHSAETVSSD